MKKLLLSGTFMLLAAAAVFSGYKYYETVRLPEKQLDEAYEKQEELIGRIRPDVHSSDELVPEAENDDPLVLCEEVNSDIAAWITIPGTNIDFPIVQGSDNEYYLHNGADGEYNYDIGCPFLDYRCESDLSGFNSIVYAHNISGGRMFGDIPRFSDKAYLDSHSQGILFLKDGQHNVSFFAYLTVPEDSPLYGTVFLTESEREGYIAFLKEKASYILPFADDIIAETDDLHLLLLSTCTYEFEGARGVLAGIIQ